MKTIKVNSTTIPGISEEVNKLNKPNSSEEDFCVVLYPKREIVLMELPSGTKISRNIFKPNNTIEQHLNIGAKPKPRKVSLYKRILNIFHKYIWYRNTDTYAKNKR